MSIVPPAHPSFKSDLPFGSAATSTTGVLHIARRIPSSDKPPGNYWVVSKLLLPNAVSHFATLGYDLAYFTPYSTKANWIKFNPTAFLAATDIIPQAPSPPSTPTSPHLPPPLLRFNHQHHRAFPLLQLKFHRRHHRRRHRPKAHLQLLLPGSRCNNHINNNNNHRFNNTNNNFNHSHNPPQSMYLPS